MPPSQARGAILTPLSVLLVSLVACAGPADTGTPSPTEPTGAGSPTADSTMPEPTDEGRGSCTPPDLCPGSLTAGEYRSETLPTTIAFTVGEGWEADVDIPDVGVSLFRSDIAAPHALSITHFSGEVFATACNSADQTEEIERSAASFMEWLRGRDGVEATDPTETRLGGQSALQVDLTTTLPEGCTEPEWIWLWVLPVVGDFHFNDEEQARVIAADVAEATLVIVVEAFPGVDYDAFLAASMEVIESMAIQP